MPDLLNRMARGQTWDQAFPVPAAIRPTPLPQRPQNDYLAHRILVDLSDGRFGCDCGTAFSTATELGQHQQYYRHPKPRPFR